MNSTPVRSLTPGPLRKKLWKSDLSSTTMSYVPGSSWVTRFPLASVSEIVNSGPTVALSSTASAGPENASAVRAAAATATNRRRVTGGTPLDRRLARQYVRRRVSVFPASGFSGAQDGAEALRERVDDPGTQRSRILVRKRALARLEGDVERDRLLALAHLVAVVDVEDPHGAQLVPGRHARSLDQLAGGQALVHDEREV